MLQGNKKNFLSKEIQSFGHALRGIKVLVATQAHARFHLLATIVVVALGLVFSVSKLDWLILLLAIMAVWVAEALNTSIEFLCDRVSPEYNDLVKSAKDVAAASVLLASMGALILGALVFWPYICV